MVKHVEICYFLKIFVVGNICTCSMCEIMCEMLQALQVIEILEDDLVRFTR